MPVVLRQYGRKDKPPTKLRRYDVYLHENRDSTMIEHLKEFENENRGRNAEIKRLMYAGLDCHEPKVSQTRSAPMPVFEPEPNTAKGKLKRVFG